MDDELRCRGCWAQGSSFQRRAVGEDVGYPWCSVCVVAMPHDAGIEQRRIGEPWPSEVKAPVCSDGCGKPAVFERKWVGKLTGRKGVFRCQGCADDIPMPDFAVSRRIGDPWPSEVKAATEKIAAVPPPVLCAFKGCTEPRTDPDHVHGKHSRWCLVHLKTWIATEAIELCEQAIADGGGVNCPQTLFPAYGSVLDVPGRTSEDYDAMRLSVGVQNDEDI